jgi:hypothetical protein
VFLRFASAFGEAVPIGKLQAFVHNAHELAAVVSDAGMNLVRHRRRRHEVAPPDFDRIDAENLGGAVHQLFDEEGCLRPSGSTIGRHRCSIGEHSLRSGMHRRYVVDAWRELDGKQRYDDRCLEQM